MEVITNNIGKGLRVDNLGPKFNAGSLVWFLMQGRPIQGMVTGYQVDVLASGKVESFNYKVGFVQVSPDGYEPVFQVIPENALRETKEELVEIVLKSLDQATVEMPQEYVPLFENFALGLEERS